MTNPVEVERHFLELQQQLSGNPSYRYQWLLISDFLGLIDGHFKTYDTHCEQLAEQLPVFTHPLSFAGTDPRQLELILELFSEALQEIPRLESMDRVPDALESLKTATAFLYVCLHEFEAAGRLLFDDSASKKGKYDATKDSYLAFIASITESIPDEDVRGGLELLQRWWKTVSHKKTNSSLCIPVVEETASGKKLGRVRELTATVSGENDKSDKFRNSYSVVGAESGKTGVRQEVITATRSLLCETHPGLRDRFFHVQFEYALPFGLHMGRSAEFASFITGYSTILDAAGSRERYRPKDSVAVTGTLENNDRVGPVDSKGIPAKLQAAFFSWVEALVVPGQQKNRFLEQLAILQETYPDRKLTLIGLEEPKAFFYDRRISDHRLDSKTKYLAKKAWQQKFSVAGIATIVLLLAVIGRLWYGPIDKNPLTASYDGSMMMIENQYGNVVRQIEVGSYTVDRFNNNQRSVPHAFYDVNGDGTNEILWSKLLNPNSSNQRLSHLNCLDIVNDSVLWSIPLEFKLDFPQKEDVSTHQYNVHRILFNKGGNNTGSNLIVALKHTNFFPSILIAADSFTGKIKGKYIHVGHIADLELVDLNGDKQKEIILLAQNNAFNEITTISVLSAGHLDGHSPLKGDYIIDNEMPASEIAYLAIPRTIVGKAFKKRVVNNTPKYLTINSEEKLIEVRVNDFQLPEATMYEADHGTVIFYFNYNLQLQSIGTNSYYDLWAKNLYESGRIPYIPDHEYFDAFRDSILYWNGKVFNRVQ